MTENKDFKQIVRARAGRTGESYAEARRQLTEKSAPPLSIHRAMPDLRSDDVDACKAFYVGLIGFRVSMEEGKFLLFSSPSDPKVQLTVNGDQEALPPGFAVDVGTEERVSEIHAAALARGLRLVEPLDDKPWGIRRFSLLDPSGTRVTVLAHLNRG
jgi:catechol 2,3-dioxygenase-like lactoylglutathione lyase family enzyme